ncbi:hypothetical protein [Streptomyces reticuli]|uniref:hypothetical protein n=1 Tax=Streptomyces reticuli TaxID=1926 RepID=UPI00073DF0D1|nr:hypothetical protein TUE45_pSRTUE45b_0009 [Streptomyces reticuli]
MAQTKFDKQMEENADSLVRGIARVLAGRDLDGVKRTDATFWRAGTRVLPKVEGKVRRRSYKPGWRRLSFRIALGAGVWEIGYLATQDLDATVQNTQELWDHREQVLATLESGGIGAASVLTVGTAAYMVLTRERRELMREWVVPLHEAIHRPLGLAEQTDPRRYLHIPKNFSDDDAEIRIDLPGHLDFSRDVIADRVTQGTPSGRRTTRSGPRPSPPSRPSCTRGARPASTSSTTDPPPSAVASFPAPASSSPPSSSPGSAPACGSGSPR